MEGRPCRHPGNVAGLLVCSPATLKARDKAAFARIEQDPEDARVIGLTRRFADLVRGATVKQPPERRPPALPWMTGLPKHAAAAILHHFETASSAPALMAFLASRFCRVPPQLPADRVPCLSWLLSPSPPRPRGRRPRRAGDRAPGPASWRQRSCRPRRPRF
jgi:hypothetical protein